MSSFGVVGGESDADGSTRDLRRRGFKCDDGVVTAGREFDPPAAVGGLPTVLTRHSTKAPMVAQAGNCCSTICPLVRSFIWHPTHPTSSMSVARAALYHTPHRVPNQHFHYKQAISSCT